MELSGTALGVSDMKQQSCWGVLLFFWRPHVSPVEKHRNQSLTSDGQKKHPGNKESNVQFRNKQKFKLVIT
jgi:hypothetical protein